VDIDVVVRDSADVRLVIERLEAIGYLPAIRWSPTSMSELAVERALGSDASAVEALLDAAAEWQESRGIEQWRPGSFHEEVQETIDLGEFYVGRRDGAIVGCFLLDSESPSWMRPWLIEQGREPTEAAHLGRLAVARGPSGKGLGVDLLRVASALAAEQGFAYVRLDCPAENRRLRRYYLDAGYSHVGNVKARGPNGERWVSSVFERSTEAEPMP
jgi:GNAT superfamily N-acetyltransferase